MEVLRYFGSRHLTISSPLYKTLILIESWVSAVILITASPYSLRVFTCHHLTIILMSIMNILTTLWPLYDSLSAECIVVVMGDLNGDVGNSLGN